jgi:hypothetical protein
MALDDPDLPSTLEQNGGPEGPPLLICLNLFGLHLEMELT